MIKVLPSMFTLANLLCGFAAIFYASREPDIRRMFDLSPLSIAAWLIFLGMVFDALDGRIARLTRQTSELGEQLDSMADMVTFGAAPAFLVIQLVEIGTPFFAEATERANVYFDRTVLCIAAVYVACCALRLARYNIEINQPGESDHLSFKGLPSPAAAGTVSSLVLLHQTLLADHTQAARATAVGMVGITLLAAIAMVSMLRYTHVLNRYIRDRAPFQTIALAVMILIPVLIFPHLTLAAGFVVYALSSPAMLLFHRLRRRARNKIPSP